MKKKVLFAMLTAALCGAALAGGATTGYAYFTNYAALDPSPSKESGEASYSCYLINNDTVSSAAGLESWLKENGGITRENIDAKSAAALLSNKDYKNLAWDGGSGQYSLQMTNNMTALTTESAYKYAVILAAPEKTSEAPDFAYEILKGSQMITDWTFDDSSKSDPVTWTPAPMPSVTVEVPEVAGATAELYAFNVNGGWKAVETNAVPSNATVRVLWTADDGKGLTADKAKGAYQWQAEFGPVVGGEIAPAPTVGEAGASEVTVDIDTRAKKSYFDAADILPVWYAAGAEVKVQGQGQQSWETLVKSSATNDTVRWTPAAPDTYTLSHTAFENATIIYALPVEVTTNDLEVAGTTAQVTDDGGQPLVAQTEGELAGKLIVPSNSTVTVTWTVEMMNTYFADGSTQYTQTFTADKSVNAVSEVVTKPEEPKEPSVKVGIVAQRYPWDGKLDVQYWAKNTPNSGYLLKVTVTLPDGTSATETHAALGGKNTTTFDMKKAFGEVTAMSGVKVTAKIVIAPPQ